MFTIFDVEHLFGDNGDILPDFVKQVQNMNSQENIMWLHNFSDDPEKTEKLKNLLNKYLQCIGTQANTLSAHPEIKEVSFYVK